jgi:hypothetical protein
LILTSCEQIVNIEQCDLDVADTPLRETCGVYGDSCRRKCSALESGSCETGGRDEDCFLIVGNPSSSGDACVNKVGCDDV